MVYEIKTPILKRNADLALEIMRLAGRGEIADYKIVASINRKISQALRFFKKGDLQAAYEVQESAEAELAHLKHLVEFGGDRTGA